MTKPHPMSSQCTAHSKRTHERCKNMVVGGGVCKFHGGAAPQVAASREVRIIATQAQHDAYAQGIKPRDAASALTSALGDADLVVQKIKQDFAAGHGIDPQQIEAFGQWLDRVGRLSKLVIDAKLEERQGRRDEQTAKMIADAIRGVLAELDLTPEQQRMVPLVVPRQLRIVAGETA